MRILHLDDSADDAELVRLYLKRNGLNVEILAATNPEEFARELEKGPLDLVIVDNSLPGFSGIDALKLSQEKLPSTPCIILSGAGDDRRREDSERAGAAAYVLKHDFADLLAAIKRFKG